jgi:anthranilate synthase component 1
MEVLMIFPSFDRVKAIAPGYDIVPVYMEILSDVRTPISVLKALKQVSSHTYLLESADNSNHWGRYSFLGYDPKIELFCKNHTMTIKDGTTRTFECSNPAAEIRNILSQYKSPRLEELPTFTGGFVGYFACEYIRYIEPTLDFPTPDDDPAMVNDVDLMLFDKVIAFDHYKNKIYLIANISTNDLERNYNKAELELKALADLVVNGKEADVPKGVLKTEFTSEFTKDEFEAVVKKTQHYIKEGDIFQCVVSNRREAEFDGSLLNAYRVLRTLNPSPYMFYLSGGNVELTGASPETLVKLTDGKMYTFPIAGTMRRGKTEAEDLAIEEKLINDEKELAEHNMLVDLGRNDLGKISKFGSVKVEALHMLQRFSHVIHITSTVSGDMQDGKDALDAIGATLPAGTLSGAPKIRAIEILHELEKSPRGVYGGAVGYIDFSGNMDVCIGIRMAMNKGGKVYVRAGAGIVRDSVPASEYNETLIKGQSMISAITDAQEVE